MITTRRKVDLEWMSALADACGEHPATPDVARIRIASLLAEAERRGAAQALRWAGNDRETGWAISDWLHRQADRIESGENL